MENTNQKLMIQQGFDTVAAGYDHPSLCFFLETAKHLIEHLNLNPEGRFLDVCTGTGVVALNAAETLTDGRVIGIDLSSGMLQQAKAKALDQGLNNIDFKQMDLEHLEFDDGSFDVATSSFGLFFLEDMTAGLQNIVDVVRPGGKVAITTFTGEAFSPMADIFIKHYEDTGRSVPPLSWKRLATFDLIREQYAAVGIKRVEIHHKPLGYHMSSSQQWWDVVWNAGWRSFLNQLSVAEQKDFKRFHLQEIDNVIGDKGFWFNTEVLIAIGEKD